MTLYENKDEFRAALVSAANVLGVSQAIVEKDYFVAVLLKKIVDRVPGISSI